MAFNEFPIETKVYDIDGITCAQRDDVTSLLADITLTYTTGTPSSVVSGEYVRTRSEGFSYEVAASGATDQHVTTAGGVKLYVLPGASGFIASAFGSGQAALESAAVAASGDVLFFSPGVYEYRNAIKTAAKAVVGLGATLKLADGIQTNTTAAVSGSGSVDIPVTSAAGFQVGDGIIIFYAADSVSPNDEFGTDVHRITAISGNTITVQTAQTIPSIASDAKVQRGSRGLICTADCEVQGLTFDGNVANQPDAYWVTHAMLTQKGNSLHTDNVKFINTPSDAILTAGAAGNILDITTVQKTEFRNIGANCVHQSYSKNAFVTKCIVVGANKKSTSGAELIHQDGAFIMSNECHGMYVDNCDVEDALSVAGSVDSADNAVVSVTNCPRIYNVRLPIEANFGSPPSPGKIRFTGNNVSADFPYINSWDRSEISITNNELTEANRTADVWIEDNTFNNVKVYVARVRRAKIKGNVSILSDGSLVAMELQDNIDLDVLENFAEGGANHYWVRYTSNFNADRLRVNGNTSLNARFYPILVDAEAAVGGNVKDGKAVGNILKTGPSSLSGWVGVRASDGLRVLQNDITHTVGTYYERLSGAAQPGGLFLDDNTINGAKDNPRGTFTISSGGAIDVAAPNIRQNAVITLMAKNAAAANLQSGAAALYIFSLTTGTSFKAATANGSSVSTSCEFYYTVANPMA